MPSGFGAGLSAVYPGMMEADQLAADQEMHRLQVQAHMSRLQQAAALQPYRQARLLQMLSGSPNRGRRAYDPSQDLLPGAQPMPTPAGAPPPLSPMPPGAGVASQPASPTHFRPLIPKSTAPAGVPPSGGSAPPPGTQAPSPPGGGASPDAALQRAIQQRDRYRPGSKAWKDLNSDVVRLDRDLHKGTAKTAKGGSVDDQMVNRIADAIKSGHQPPDLKGMYKYSAPVRSALEDRGFDLAAAQQEWMRAQRSIAALNSPQLTRFQGIGNSVLRTLDRLQYLTDQMDQPGFNLFNKASLLEAMKIEGNSPRGQLATTYITTLNTLKEEFATLATGGYAPTESVWALANSQMNGEYGVKQMGASLQEIRRLINYRLQAVPNIGTLGPNAPNRYVQPSAPVEEPSPAPPAGPTLTTPAAAPSRPVIVGPNGEKMTLSPDGASWVPMTQ